MGTFHHTCLAAAHSDKHAVLQKGVNSFSSEPGRCMATESGVTASGNPRCERSTEPPVQAKGKTASKVNATTKTPVIDNWGNSAGFHAARQDAQLPRLTVHWLSVTRATEGPLSEISGPYFSLAPAAIDIGHVDSLDGPLVSIPEVVKFNRRSRP